MLWTLFQIAVVLLAAPLIIGVAFWVLLVIVGVPGMLYERISRPDNRPDGSLVVPSAETRRRERVAVVAVGVVALSTALAVAWLVTTDERTKATQRAAEWAEACRRTPSLCATDGGSK